MFLILLNGLTTSFHEFGRLYRKHRDRDRVWVAHGTMLASRVGPENGENEPVERVIINFLNSHPETECLVTEGAILRRPGSSEGDALAGTTVEAAVADVLRRIGNGEFPDAETTMQEATADLGKWNMMEYTAFQLWKELVWRDAKKVVLGAEGVRVDAAVHVAGQREPRKVQLRAMMKCNSKFPTGHGAGRKHLFHKTDIDDFVGHKLEWSGEPLAPGSRVVAVDFNTVATSEMEKVKGLISTTTRANGSPIRPWAGTAPLVDLGSVEHTSRRFERVGNTDKWREVGKGDRRLPLKKRMRFLESDNTIQVESGGLDALK